MYSKKKKKKKKGVNESGKETNSSSSIWLIKPAIFIYLKVKRYKTYVRGNRNMIRAFTAMAFNTTQ